MEPKFGSPGARLAAVAGSWYPGEAAALRTTLEEMLAGSSAAAAPPPRALVVPHAGLAYSGRTAAAGFACLRPGDYDRVIVLAPSHRVPLRGTAADPSTHYETPLGRLPVDVEAVRWLGAHHHFEVDPRPFTLEHAIEMQVPFLQLRLPAACLVPVLVGELRAAECKAAAGAIGALLDPRTLLVVSSDFTHYGPHYGYVPFQDRVVERIHDLDQGAVDAIVARDAAQFADYLARTGATICGRRPLGVLLDLVPASWKAELVAYTTSGEITGDSRNSVSYACIAFRESRVGATVAEGTGVAAPSPALGPSAVDELPAGDRHALLWAARQALEALFAAPGLQGRLAKLPTSARLLAPSGAFVTLHRRRDGRLRGCIGSIAPRHALLEAVTQASQAAAQRDPRFEPLRREELADLEIEISVLGPLVPVHDVAEIVLGRDGLVVTEGLQRGVLLPQVATDQRWTTQEFLENVCRKANLPANAWRKRARVERFAATVFTEPAPGAMPTDSDAPHPGPESKG